MNGAQVHFEVFVCRRPGGDWTLDMATEDRDAAVAAANARVAEGKAIAARVSKETLDEETRGFRTAVIHNVGDAGKAPVKKLREKIEPLCVSPQDLYSLHARDRIGRLLEGFLDRHRATPFELLHRPDLAEVLESSGTDLQHALQKISIPEAQERGVSVHELIRNYQALVERTIERLLKDKRKGVLPDLSKESYGAVAERVAREPERLYLLGAGVAGAMVGAKTWTDKVTRLLDLADAAPLAGPPRGTALQAVEQPLAEILGSKFGLEEILGRDLDLGATLAAMTRLAAAEIVDPLVAHDASVAKVMPELPKAAQRLATWLAADEFEAVRAALARRVLRELNGPRRLRPSDAAGEIDILRGLAMALSAAAGRLVPIDDVQTAFAARSQGLVTSDFVEGFLGQDRSAMQEAEALVWLVENVIGAANKRRAGRYLAGIVTALRFEKEVRYGPDSPISRLSLLAKLHRGVARCGLAEEDYKPIQHNVGELGGLVEADAKLVAAVAKAPGPVLHRLTLLLRLASGDQAPMGPAAERARTEALKLVRLDETRAELARSPEGMGQVRDLLAALGKAA